MYCEMGNANQTSTLLNNTSCSEAESSLKWFIYFEVSLYFDRTSVRWRCCCGCLWPVEPVVRLAAITAGILVEFIFGFDENGHFTHLHAGNLGMAPWVSR